MRTRIGAVWAVITLLAVLTAPAVALASGLHWSRGQMVARIPPFAGFRQPLSSVSCGSNSLCIGADSSGLLVASTDPAGGTWREWPFVGQPSDIFQESGAVGAVTCPSAGLCVVVGTAPPSSAGNGAPTAWTSTDPATGTWRGAKLPGSDGNEGIEVSCPTTQFCVAADDKGSIFTSSNPAADAWTAAGALSTAPAALSCPAANLCLAALYQGAQNEGYVASTTDPSSGNWALTPIEPNLGITEMACPSTSLCVAFDGGGGVLTSTNPASGGWTRREIDSGHELTASACPSSGLCVAVDHDGGVLSSTSPASGGWTRTHVDSQPLISLACPSTALCVAGDGAGDALTSRDPGDPATPWTIAPAVGITRLSGVSCSATGLCAVVDATGHAYVTTDAAAGLSAWSGSEIDPRDRLSGVSCLGAHMCVAIDHGGDALTSTNPAGGGTWRRATVDPLHAPTAISCPGVLLCVAVDDHGDVISSRDPEGATPRWRVAHVHARGLGSISCPTVNLCVAAEGGSGPEKAGADPTGGEVLTSADPSGGARKWRTVRISSSDHLLGVSCTAARLCVAAGIRGTSADNGDEPVLTTLTSATPLGRAPWTRRKIGVARGYFGGDVWSISCSSAGFCATAGTDSSLRASTPDSKRWWPLQYPDTDPNSGSPEPLTGVSCVSAQLCVAIDAIGQVLVGSG